MDSHQVVLLGATILVLFGLWYLFNFLGSFGFTFSQILGAGLGFGVIVAGLFIYWFIYSTSKMKL